MPNFVSQIQQELAIFLPYQEQLVTINSALFAKKTQKVTDFMQEIEATALLLHQQQTEEYLDVYSRKLFQQFEALYKVMIKLKVNNQTENMVFCSSFRFEKNIHALPPVKRLTEYKKALRALNEKISWLIKMSYTNGNENIQQQIQETEFRKQKCLKAIDELEEEILILHLNKKGA
ncbi:primosomal replication protein N [[Haemophilus] ducreyi]|uniref:primosomal replication protein PriC n=1 Tax=Haemophilus ducreyi TaxID=730 RepID=UPI0007CDB4E7|nr:primosomal replication protein PriC [[Haemophilus] ducreyi]ANF61350.1 primosomal replication protein N [[Haemophilus] ducreyi]